MTVTDNQKSRMFLNISNHAFVDDRLMLDEVALKAIVFTVRQYGAPSSPWRDKWSGMNVTRAFVYIGENEFV